MYRKFIRILNDISVARSDLEELQHIWSEVHKEITEMETLMKNRLEGKFKGNNNYNPLISLDVIEKVRLLCVCLGIAVFCKKSLSFRILAIRYNSKSRQT